LFIRGNPGPGDQLNMKAEIGDIIKTKSGQTFKVDREEIIEGVQQVWQNDDYTYPISSSDFKVIEFAEFKSRLSKKDIQDIFNSEIIFLTEITSDRNYFHTAKKDDFCIFISELYDEEDGYEIMGTVFKNEIKNEKSLYDTDLSNFLNRLKEQIASWK